MGLEPEPEVVALRPIRRDGKDRAQSVRGVI